ncbi:MAG: Flap endonuclease Xni [Pseudomonadota bacterium]|nr:MAG: Flap endonuclease Xni [Pseudomonadota bacterium]
MHVLLVDGLNLIRRVYAGVPQAEASETRSESVVNACLFSLQRALRSHPATHAVCALDSNEPGWRKALYPDYKKNRSPMPEELRDILLDVVEAFQSAGVRSITVSGLEADDVIATIARRVIDSNNDVTVLSTDKSFCQLIGFGVRVYDHFADVEHDRNWTRTRFGVEPEILADLFALAGDTSLGISGIRSVGVHTAVKLLNDHGTLEGVLAAAGDITGKLGSKLRDGRADARLAKKLVSLVTDAQLGMNLKDFRIGA